MALVQDGDEMFLLLPQDAPGSEFVVALETALRSRNAEQSLVVERIEYPDPHPQDGCSFFGLHFRLIDDK